jgi:hypothetical protein
LNYLANNTRPDINMAVYQWARYCSNPKAIHELGVKCIALLKTQINVRFASYQELGS